MLHKRSDKNSHLDTILYEIDMFRHCSKTLAAKKARSAESEEAEAEYNLVIEGFLLHLRNLLAFFTTKHSRDTDLRLNAPEVWLGRQLEEKEYADLRDEAQAFNENYSETLGNGKKLDCHDLISKFLQHCTPERFEQSVVGWKIEQMVGGLDPVLAKFEKRFQAPAAPVVKAWLTSDSHSTTTMRRYGVLFDAERKS